MAWIGVKGLRFEAAEGETVLDALLRVGIDAPHSCRKGTCGTCRVRHVGGQAPPTAAQSGLRETLREQGYFHACQCVPSGDMEVAFPDEAECVTAATLLQKDFPSPEVCRLRLRQANPLEYRAGQHVLLQRNDGLARNYSLASVPQLDDHLELHVRRYEHGAMSRWVFETLQVGDEVRLRGPFGDCFYASGAQDAPMLLVATGTGLAPLLGVAQDALVRGHRGRIVLYHGVRHPSDAYGRDELERLTQAHPSFEAITCVSRHPGSGGFVAGRADDVAFTRFDDLTGWRVYLCGSPAMVAAGRRTAYLAGARMADISADAFDQAAAGGSGT